MRWLYFRLLDKRNRPLLLRLQNKSENLLKTRLLKAQLAVSTHGKAKLGIKPNQGFVELNIKFLI